ncbi:MAG: GNAT family N-acetyltransferase [Ruminococcaceae bacterium]|nr:GNAT family N-acetyltransferase [Oscillospiraceae bacterium]
MNISLQKAGRDDLVQLHAMQVEAFLPLLDIYHDHDLSPAAESVERIIERFEQPFTTYWFIIADGERVGALRVCDFGERCMLSPIFILPRHQGKGAAQAAITLMEQQYPDAQVWELSTIRQEAGLCHLYEKMGYSPTGRILPVKEGMDIVFYEKQM